MMETRYVYEILFEILHETRHVNPEMERIILMLMLGKYIVKSEMDSASSRQCLWLIVYETTLSR
jgi:hypothetical protein